VSQRVNPLFGHASESPGEFFPHLVELLIQLPTALGGRQAKNNSLEIAHAGRAPKLLMYNAAL
jgi:hypothetical protein